MATIRPAPMPAEAAAQAASATALAAALRRPQAAPELLREVMRRRPATLRQTLEGIATDAERPAELRTIAVVGLGSLRDARSTGALLAAAKAADVGLARRAFEALGRIGTADTLAELKRLRAPAGPAARSLAFARSLIAYRHGLDGERLELPRGARPSTLDEQRALVLPAARLDARGWSALKPALQGADRTLAPTDKPPIEIRCGKDRLLLLVNPALDDDAAAPALARPVVAAVLMKHSPTLARWFVAEYVFAHPTRSGAAELIGARPSGRVVHRGQVAGKGAQLALQLQALDTPLSAPTRVSATLGTAAGLALQVQVEPDRSRNRSVARKPRAAA